LVYFVQNERWVKWWELCVHILQIKLIYTKNKNTPQYQQGPAGSDCPEQISYTTNTFTKIYNKPFRIPENKNVKTKTQHDTVDRQIKTRFVRLINDKTTLDFDWHG